MEAKAFNSQILLSASFASRMPQPSASLFPRARLSQYSVAAGKFELPSDSLQKHLALLRDR